MANENENVITLVSEDGENVEFHHLMTFEYKKKVYLALQMLEEDDDMVTIMRVAKDDNGDEVYEMIEDEQEMQDAFDEFVAIMEEEDEEE